ncbi:MAG: hypothetical protein R3195_10180 [Gemmatimonadota bacterium]|nr:hypothetical protein [Gemmatimonadota bacterium]
MSERTHSQNFAAGQHGAVSDHTPAGKAAAWAGESHRLAAEKRAAEEEAARRRKPFRFTLHVPRPVRPLSPDDMKQIDAWAEWWFDTDTLFGLANLVCFAVGALGGLGWAIVSAVAQPTFGSVVLMPIAAFFLGGLAGALAVTGAIVWGLWKVGALVTGLF